MDPPLEARIETARGPAAVTLYRPETTAPGARNCLLVLTHGSAGGVDAPDLVATRDMARERGATVAMVTQAYRVAGRRSPGGNTGPQDESWTTVVRQIRAWPGLGESPLVLAGRSNGARVACRSAVELGAHAVVALAFPLHPPGKPHRSRDAELRAAGVPRLVVNGASDPFGIPEPDEETTVIVRRGERHDLARAPREVATGVVDWLAERGLVAHVES
ncbi:alpha/beta hydrolase [Lipingzhangella sp. LS1_29]|uniref:Alpha/beta hydrolase n=1 Tax=Lipingzhangella rawalii TaxID=2055835 RepID=A0ABU2H2Z0_9ACTN|nr:alpha/beta family hydrolase [Lipingzhangella rawalii]MDS1269214.1 alpha/beta hydrolase [Lipingzhangella rawalii]